MINPLSSDTEEMPFSSREKGQRGEEVAVNFLRNYKDYSILDRNYKRDEGEIDIVAREDDTLIFAEVKTDYSQNQGNPINWVNERKRERIVKTAEFYLLEKEIRDLNIRFDVITIRPSRGLYEINHLQRAFRG